MSKSGKQRQREARAPRVAIVVPGGIRAQNTRNLKTRAWWARRWLETLESFALGSRLGRGRGYAASGQIRALETTPGLVTAIVQGANPLPYTTQLQFRTLAPAALARFTESLRTNPMWAARLAVRDFPKELETLFLSLGCPLFPAAKEDVAMRCTCRDWGKPCKHLAALFYVMAEAVERDPPLVFVLRGVPRELFAPTVGNEKTDCAKPLPTPTTGEKSDRSLADEFWGEKTPGFHHFGPVPKHAPPLARSLGTFPYWRGVERLFDATDHVHARATALGAEILSGAKFDFSPVQPEAREPLFRSSGGRFFIDTTV